ncbi:MAG: MATE family efflux transporter, partial [Firmicutes bacterium]|nr:MATE family efflux transporter [Bacillota bacterium]
IAYLWGDSLLRLIGATDANIQMAHDYGVIIFAMMPLAMTQNTLASIIRADGSPKYAMTALLLAHSPLWAIITAQKTMTGCENC